MTLYEKHADQRDRFEIVAFHDDTAETFEDLDEKLARVIEKKWDGKTLPFPVVLDATGETLDRWGIHRFPTTVLLDPEGRLVKGGGERMLEEVLEAPPPAPVPREPPHAAVDFRAVDRSIGKEPGYVAQPRYALFLFGPRGEMRVWAVLDKSEPDAEHYDVLYMDTDADGDLTEPGERFTGTWREAGARAGMGLVIKVGDLAVPGTDRVHRDLLVSTVPKEGREGIWFRMEWNGEVRVSGGSTVKGDTTTWAPTPAEAPILRPTPRGRLAFGFYGWGADAIRWTIGEEERVYLVLGNPGSGPDTLCPVSEDYLVEGEDRIVATLVARDAEGREVRSEAVIDGHC